MVPVGLFKAKYGKELIGAVISQFNCDLHSFQYLVNEINSYILIALSKKSYLNKF